MRHKDCEFQASVGYIVSPWVKNKTKPKTKHNNKASKQDKTKWKYGATGAVCSEEGKVPQEAVSPLWLEEL